ncbi:MAG: HpcH/HpaI aldolase/citrate lyase family protein [Bacilli bacterium]|jgi:citrate lyase subunit beta/citryl-CoA lyase|nr:HpcH/HpaI aldolase/citrate lyase family protein [Bacilli bacterium]
MALPFIRSALFIPANNPGMVQTAHLLGSDAIIFDLEDAISLNQKDSARELLKAGFEFFQKDEVIRIVRINPMDSPYFNDDIAMVKSFNIDYIMLAKASISSVKALAEALSDTNIKIIALIESANGVLNLKDILSASPLVEGMLFGAEDFALDMQIERTKQSDEILMARQQIALTCKALNKFCFDTPFTDTEDFEMLNVDIKKAKAFGFTGKACINPRQVKYVNAVFTPTIKEIEYAQEVIFAAKKAQEEGLGVFSLNGKMVDAPIINRSQLVLENALKAGVINE